MEEYILPHAFSSPIFIEVLVTNKAMAPHSSTLAWKIPWTEEPGRLQSMGSLESDTTEPLPFHFSLSCIGEGNGSPLQCSCLENPRDREAWWAAIYGVTQSWTRLKQLSTSIDSWSYSPRIWISVIYICDVECWTNYWVHRQVSDPSGP